MSTPRTLLLLVLLLSAAPAFATTMLALDLDALVARSDVIAVVRVESVETVRTRGRMTRHVALVVEEGLSGVKAGDALTARVPGGEAGDLIQRVHGAPEPVVGGLAMVFLWRDGGGYLRAVGLSQGWLAITNDPDDPTRQLVKRSIEARLLAPDPNTGRLGPAPGLPDTEPLLPLLDRVRRAVEAR